ncbi:MAG: amidohydrolase family protein, partial [Gemmatimonadetes bacterium]|nr:amidohydrolase family protein [Gemmatimonadota bacterium]
RRAVPNPLALFVSSAALSFLIGPGGLTGQGLPRYDVTFTGGHVIDGAGNPWFRADVAVREGRIVRIGDLGRHTADRTVDAQGLVVVPGFVDLHSHAGDEGRGNDGLTDPDARYRAAPNLVAQGVTTLVANQDGRSPWPIRTQRETMEAQGTGPNTLLLVGHGRLRSEVMGDDFRRPARPEEVDRMRALLRQGLEEGAFGMSAGHEYTPMIWSETEEVVALAEEVAAAGGIYVVHERSSGAEPMWWWPSQDAPGAPSMIDAVLETIQVAERTGVTAVQTHIKARGADFWGASATLVNLIGNARSRGVPIWADLYSYNTTGTDGSALLMPRWAVNDASYGSSPADRVETVLADPALAEKARLDIGHEIRRRGGAENLLILDHPDPAMVGRTLQSLTEEWEMPPVHAAIRLQTTGDRNAPGGARLRGFSLSEIDLRRFIRQPWIASASDAGITLPGDGFVHPRYYGNFPRRIKRYAIDEGLVPVEDAVRSMTSLPAQILGLRDRGLVREGFHADLVVMDLNELEDRATALDPHQYPGGMPYVMVGGTFVVDQGELTWALPGTIVTPADRGSPPVSQP